MSTQDNDVDNIINQLKNQGRILQKVEKHKEKSKLSKDEVEEFILDSAKEVVEGCIDMFNDLKDTALTDPNPSMIESVACLVNAFNGAIDTLSKIQLLDTKIKGQKEIKQMDIDHKSLPKDNLIGPGILVSREDVVKALLDRKPQIEESPIIDV